MYFKTVMIAGKFDPPHEGHIDHIKKAAKLGDLLIIITHTDEVIKTVRAIEGKAPICHLKYVVRRDLLSGLLLLYHISGAVRLAKDLDGTVASTIRFYSPDVFAKGGDRDSSNMPPSEIYACEEVKCQIVYGVGDLLNSSSKLME